MHSKTSSSSLTSLSLPACTLSWDRSPTTAISGSSKLSGVVHAQDLYRKWKESGTKHRFLIDRSRHPVVCARDLGRANNGSQSTISDQSLFARSYNAARHPNTMTKNNRRCTAKSVPTPLDLPISRGKLCNKRERDQ